MGEANRRVYYDQKAGIPYALLKEGRTGDTIDAGEDIFVKPDEIGEIVDVEIWRASDLLEPIAARIEQAALKPTRQRYKNQRPG